MLSRVFSSLSSLRETLGESSGHAHAVKRRRARKRTHAIPWDDYFADQVALLATLDDVGEQNGLLHVLDLYVSADTFTYPDRTAERVGKRCLLDLWELLLRWMPHVPEARRTLRTRFVAHLMVRYEFDLVHLRRLGAATDEGHGLLTGLSSEDVSIAHRYRRTVLETTRFAIEHVDEDVDLCLSVLATAYFRLPILSGTLLDAACALPPTSDNDDESKTPTDRLELLDELDEIVELQQQQNNAAVSVSKYFFEQNPSLFQWTVFSGSSDHAVVRLCAQVSSMVSRRFPLFFLHVLQHVSDVAHGEVRWSLVPGYASLTRALLRRMISEPPHRSPDTLACVGLLLQNRRLLPVFTKALLRLTSVHDKLAVNVALDSLDNWFCVVTVSSSSWLPDTFCYEELLTALRVLLASEHFQMLIKALWFLYAHLDRFSFAFRERVFRQLLLSNVFFFKLFLHWCPEVRRVFHFILIYKLRRGGLQASSSSSSARGTTSTSPSTITMTMMGNPIAARKAVTRRSLSPFGSPLLLSSTPSSSPSGSPPPSPPVFSLRRDGDEKKGHTGGSSEAEGDDSGVVGHVFNLLWSLRPGSARGSERRPRELLEHDPSLETCTEVRVQVPPREREVDRELRRLLTCQVKLVEQQREQPDLIRHFSHRWTKYADQSLSELDEDEASFRRLQGYASDDSILTPDLFYNIEADEVPSPTAVAAAAGGGGGEDVPAKFIQ